MKEMKITKDMKITIVGKKSNITFYIPLDCISQKNNFALTEEDIKRIYRIIEEEKNKKGYFLMWSYENINDFLYKNYPKMEIVKCLYIKE